MSIFAKHYGEKLIDVENMPYTRFLRYQEAMYLLGELDQQQADNPEDNVVASSKKGMVVNSEEPTEYTIPQPKFIGPQ